MKYLFKVNAQNGVTNFCTLDDAPAMQQMGVDTSSWIEIDTDFGEQNKYKIADNQLILLSENEYDIYFPEVALSRNKSNRVLDLETDFNASKKITVQNGKTLEVEYDTPERDIFLKLIEDVSNLSTTEGAAFIYEQQTDAGKLALRILPEIAAYIFKDLFVATLNNPQQTKVNSRVHNKTTVYELAREEINKATTQAELDAITWNFLNETGIVIDVNDKAEQMLEDPTVSDVAKAAINAAKDPTTGEIHLVKTLQELATDS